MTIKEGTAVDTSNLLTGKLVHMEFDFYNVTSFRGFTSMLTVACEKTIMVWVFPIATKRVPARIIRFILKTLINKKHP